MWLRVDDHFWQHPKLLEIPAEHRNEAAGLWVRAGSWCVMNKTDGLIPHDVPADLLSATVDVVTRLEFAGLWIRVPGGWRMHGWDEWQPTRSGIEERRRNDEERWQVDVEDGGEDDTP